MFRKSVFCLFFTVFLIVSCSPKVSPSGSARIIYTPEKQTTTTVIKEKQTDEIPAAKEPEEVISTAKTNLAVKPKTPAPKSIYVNDLAAKQSIDGRLYYDVDGNRYWKNYKDGKYYLFNKSMYNNPDFKPTVRQ
ncbi:MAG: hypothetical protein J5I50_12625 [Chitinophagaceae bacterium]|nr:hypothetical protein [Chitinophagaceae bacterium]